MVRLTHVIAIDFEATRGGGDIIEFPAVLVNLNNGEFQGEFRKYVNVDNSGAHLRQVLNEFDSWLKLISSRFSLKIPKLSSGFGSDDYNCAFVTWGNDFGNFLHRECNRKNIHIPDYFYYCIDLQMDFKENTGKIQLSSLEDALKYYNLNFSGQPHSGIDDAKNTGKLCYEMHRRGKKVNIRRVF